MDYDQIITNLEKKIYHPVYFLHGEEPYFIDKISDYITKNVLEEHEREFNLTVLYGRDTDIDTVLSEAKRFPMMANYQVVIVKEAQHLRKLEELESYLDSPQKTTILVFCYKYKKADGRKAFVKKVGKKGVLFNSEKLRDYKIPDWIERYVQRINYTIEPKATMVLAEYLGTDLSKIHNAMQKLLMNNPAGREITAELIQKYIGINHDYNNFELQNAIGARNVIKANRIIQYFTRNEKEHPLVMIFGSLYSFFSKLLLFHATKNKSKNEIASVLRINPFFVSDYQSYAAQYDAGKVRKSIALLHEYDMKSKGVGNVSASHGELLKELLWKIMH